MGRLASATTASSTGALAWGQSYVYDPFGNLLQQNVTSSSAPTANLTVNPSTNRISTSGFTYDAAGNLTQNPDGTTYAYDSENRLSQVNGGSKFYYGSNGERLFDGTNWYF